MYNSSSSIYIYMYFDEVISVRSCLDNNNLLISGFNELRSFFERLWYNQNCKLLPFDWRKSFLHFDWLIGAWRSSRLVSGRKKEILVLRNNNNNNNNNDAAARSINKEIKMLHPNLIWSGNSKRVEQQWSRLFAHCDWKCLRGAMLYTSCDILFWNWVGSISFVCLFASCKVAKYCRYNSSWSAWWRYQIWISVPVLANAKRQRHVRN